MVAGLKETQTLVLHPMCWFWEAVDNYKSPHFCRLSLEPGKVVGKNLLSLFELSELSVFFGGHFILLHFPSSPINHAFPKVVPQDFISLFLLKPHISKKVVLDHTYFSITRGLNLPDIL